MRGIGHGALNQGMQEWCCKCNKKGAKTKRRGLWCRGIVVTTVTQGAAHAHAEHTHTHSCRARLPLDAAAVTPAGTGAGGQVRTSRAVAGRDGRAGWVARVQDGASLGLALRRRGRRRSRGRSGSSRSSGGGSRSSGGGSSGLQGLLEDKEVHRGENPRLPPLNQRHAGVKQHLVYLRARQGGVGGGMWGGVGAGGPRWALPGQRGGVAACCCCCFSC